MDGYIRQNPDCNWWLEQIKLGELYRKKTAYQDSWNDWRSYYRGNWRGDVMPFNIFFMMTRTVVPRIYFRNPSVSIVPGKPGIDNMALAKVLERVDSKLMRQMRVKQHMKRIIQHAFQFGTGFGKVGYGGLYTPNPEASDVRTQTDAGYRVEYRSDITSNLPWFSPVHPSSMVVPAGTTIYEDARWSAHCIQRTPDDIRADPRLSNTTGIRASKQIVEKIGGINTKVNLAVLYEIRDKKTGKVFIVCPDKSKDAKDRASQVLYYGDDDFAIDNEFPIYPLIFNEDDEYFWGLPDSKILEPYQLEINEIKTQTMKHRRLALIKIFIRAGLVNEDDLEKIVNGDIAPIIKTTGPLRGMMEQVQAAHIPPDLIAASEAIVQDVRETVGFGRNQFGEYHGGSGDTTATEAQIVRAASEIRVDERRDLAADMLVDVVGAMHKYIFKYWTGEDVIDLVGPGGASIWVKFTGELLSQGKYNIRVDPDTSIPQTKALREQKAMQVYSVLKENPLIDPTKLTQYLLHEMHGVQFDDMMRLLGPVDQQGPINVDQLGGLIQQGVNSMPKNLSEGDIRGRING